MPFFHVIQASLYDLSALLSQPPALYGNI